jgi:hypothetical protein
MGVFEGGADEAVVALVCGVVAVEVAVADAGSSPVALASAAVCGLATGAGVALLLWAIDVGELAMDAAAATDGAAEVDALSAIVELSGGASCVVAATAAALASAVASVELVASTVPWRASPASGGTPAAPRAADPDELSAAAFARGTVEPASADPSSAAAGAGLDVGVGAAAGVPETVAVPASLVALVASAARPCACLGSA